MQAVPLRAEAGTASVEGGHEGRAFGQQGEHQHAWLVSCRERHSQEAEGLGSGQRALSRRRRGISACSHFLSGVPRVDGQEEKEQLGKKAGLQVRAFTKYKLCPYLD